MLGKLIKHEFKAQTKMYTGLYVFGLIVSVLALITKLLSDANKNVVLWDVTAAFTFGIAAFIVVATFVVTLIFAILRYRNNLLKDEGYLMHTLPVKTWELVAAKLITSVCWFIGDAVAAYLFMSIATHDFTSVFATFNEAANDLASIGIAKGWLVAFFIIAFLMGTVSTLSQFYVSLSIGYSTHGNKDVMSFVTYIVIYFVMQLVSFLALVAGMLLNFKSILMNLDMLNSETPPSSLFWTILITGMVVGVVIAVVELYLSVHFLDKKLNLE